MVLHSHPTLKEKKEMIEEASKILDEQKFNDHKEYREKLEALFRNKEDVSFSPKFMDETFSRKLLANKETFSVGTSNGGRTEYMDYHLIKNLGNPFAQHTGGYHLYPNEAETRQFRVIDGGFPSSLAIDSDTDYGNLPSSSNQARTRVWTQRIVDHPTSVTMSEEAFEDLSEGDYDTILRGLEQTAQDRECASFAQNNDTSNNRSFFRGGSVGLKGLASYSYSSSASYNETNGNHQIVRQTYANASDPASPTRDELNVIGATILNAIKSVQRNALIDCVMIGRTETLRDTRFNSANTFTPNGVDSFPLEKFAYSTNDQTAYWLGVPAYGSDYLSRSFNQENANVGVVITCRHSGIRFELHGDLKLKVYRQSTVGAVTLFMNRRVVSTILSPDRVVAVGRA